MKHFSVNKLTPRSWQRRDKFKIVESERERGREKEEISETKLEDFIRQSFDGALPSSRLSYRPQGSLAYFLYPVKCSIFEEKREC